MWRTWLYLCVFINVSIILPDCGFTAAKKPSTLAELALYKGADRQQILEEGAKQERALTFYTSGTESQRIVDAFEKKYPFIRVERWRSSIAEQISKTVEEFKSGKHLFDAMESTQTSMTVLQEMGIAQPFYSPNFLQLEEEALTRAPGGGAFAAAFRLLGIGFAYNTKLLKKELAPKTYQDLLDPKWKGKLAIVGTDSGVSWAACIYRAYGEDLLKKIAKQEFTIHMVSALALLDQIINGEYFGSPTITDAQVFTRRQKGAPVAWLPLEPVRVNVGQIALAKHAPHPHAALLFADFELSTESAEIHRNLGYSSLRKDIPATEVRYKKLFGEVSMERIKEEHEVFNRLFLKK